MPISTHTLPRRPRKVFRILAAARPWLEPVSYEGIDCIERAMGSESLLQSYARLLCSLVRQNERRHRHETSILYYRNDNEQVPCSIVPEASYRHPAGVDSIEKQSPHDAEGEANW